MYQHNRWVECLNCGKEYSVDDLFHINKQVSCPECNSNEYTELLLTDLGITNDYISLNESLMEDGEWD